MSATNSGPDRNPPTGHQRDWKRVAVGAGAASLLVPAELQPDSIASFDSAASTWAGAGLSVLVDTGPFVDRLDRHEGKTVDINGHPARTVIFNDSGAQVTAAHFPELQMTIAVRSDRIDGIQIAQEILGSLIVEE